MLVSVHRAVSAVLRVMLVAFVTLSARVQHRVLPSKHWFSWLWSVRADAYAWLW
jgi:hypothetical protein